MSTTSIIPTDTSPFAFRETVTLIDTDYILEFNFNTRRGLWYLNVLDVNDNPLLTGRVLHTNLDLCGRFVLATLPPGTMVPINTTGLDTDADLDTFGNSILLFYNDGLA